ncbi:MAG TPA: hemolysin family protein [Longimicrobiales bacterium]|nr:hemolysin family protein [Longimicrobiales bacterium]
MFLLILALAFALLMSMVFTATEVALFSLGEARVRALVDEKRRGSASLVQLRSRPEQLLILLRLGDALADVTTGAIAAYLAYLQWNLLGLAIAIVLITLVVLFLGELLPMAFGMNRSVTIALVMAPPLLWATHLFKFPLVALEKLAGIVPDRSANTAAQVTESEIRELTLLGHSEGAIQEHERQLIERAFRLDETKAWEIMTPRVDIFAWEDTQTLAEIAPLLGTVRFSRVPVYREIIDNISGVLYLRDAHQALLMGQRDVQLCALAREPLIVPGSVTLAKLLRDFQTRRIHMAIVVDEYGGTDGLVTLEDVLEELVGEIVDETDVAEEIITRVSRTELLATGDADLREINHALNTALPQLEHRSLNGYLLEEFGRVPERGESLERDGLSIEVLDATDTQVLRARLKRATVAGPEPTVARPQRGQEDIEEMVPQPRRAGG